MQAFASPAPLRLSRQRANRCTAPVQPILTLAEKSPPANARGKRVPTFKKLQRRHRQGPAEFRQKQAEEEDSEPKSEVTNEEENIEELSQKETPKKRKIAGRPGTALSELAVGQALSGIVQNIVPHGAFVDIGATRDGLVHVRDMAIDFVHTPRDVVRSGMTVQVWVKYVDPVRDVLGLTMLKPAMGFEGRSKIGDFEIGSRHKGVVERVTNYGAYIDIGAERLAFLHVSAVWGECPRDTLDFVRLGDRVWVSVIGVDESRGHLRLFARGRNNERLTKDSELEEIKLRSNSEPISTELVTARPWGGVKEEQEDEEDEETADAEESDDTDEEEDDWDEFDFVNEDDTESDTIRLQELDDVAHMFNENTEYVDVKLEN